LALINFQLCKYENSIYKNLDSLLFLAVLIVLEVENIIDKVREFSVNIYGEITWQKK